MRLLRFGGAALLAAVVGVGDLGAPAAAAPGYVRPVDIRFPTVRTARYTDDYASYRSGGRVHAATDLFAPAGSRVYAARGGYVVWRPWRPSGSAGYAVQIRGDDRRTYAYYHLGPAAGPLRKAVAGRVAPGAYVRRGQVIGWVGDSGNARGGAPHLHFEIHDASVKDPGGLLRRNPYNSLRRAQGLTVVHSGPTGDRWTGGSDSMLHIGSRGRAVLRWQQALNRSGRVAAVAVDGIFGTQTHRVTIAFQRASGLGPTGLGIVGPRTRAAMRAVTSRRSAARPRSPGSSVAAPTTLLRMGHSGPAVAAWQQSLNRSRMAPRVTVDGSFGPATHRSTVIFQRRAGLGPAGLGIVGPRSRGAMTRVLSTQ
ncbi:MAG: peptidoglycan DD-metalloendopeptidase family protein [Nitriliruptorales bacterium]|nr:peptidoglycan DD-metalloendopeptidase family protein [Nitriliruptorales bacterium]